MVETLKVYKGKKKPDKITYIDLQQRGHEILLVEVDDCGGVVSQGHIARIKLDGVEIIDSYTGCIATDRKGCVKHWRSCDKKP